MQAAEPNAAPRISWGSPWKIAWLTFAALYAALTCYIAYDRVVAVTRQAREQLIVQHRLWELDPEYQGSPRMWTRVASHLLSDNQLMKRVRARYGDLANEIELDYHRDLTIARGEVVLVAAAAWAAPTAALYGFGLIVVRRRRAPRAMPKPPQRSAESDSRYRP
jgi:hypothetical protein